MWYIREVSSVNTNYSKWHDMSIQCFLWDGSALTSQEQGKWTKEVQWFQGGAFSGIISEVRNFSGKVQSFPLIPRNNDRPFIFHKQFYGFYLNYTQVFVA